MMSHALSLDAAMNGNPPGSPVSWAACAVIWPNDCVGRTKSGNFSRSIGNMRHLRSNRLAQSEDFTSNGTVPMALPAESTYRPVSRCVR